LQTQLAEDALRAELERLMDRHNEGTDFPARNENLWGGRSIATCVAAANALEKAHGRVPENPR
jgi:hypothetical protein